MIRKNTPRTAATRANQRAMDAAAQVNEQVKSVNAQMKPIARQASIAAKSASIAARTSAEEALAWATPRVQDARAWAAPHVEQAGYAVRDKIAPTISSALVEAAHRLDVSPVKRRRWPRVLAGIALLAAAGSAIAAVAIRRRSDVMSFGAEGYGPQDGANPAAGEADGATRTSDKAQANGSGDEAEANARVHKS